MAGVCGAAACVAEGVAVPPAGSVTVLELRSGPATLAATLASCERAVAMYASRCSTDSFSCVRSPLAIESASSKSSRSSSSALR